MIDKTSLPMQCKVLFVIKLSIKVIHLLSFFTQGNNSRHMTTFSLSIPGNIGFAGTIAAPLMVSNQPIVAPSASGTISTISIGSLAGTYSSVTQAYAATLTIGTILNYGSSLSTNLSLTGTVISTAGIFSTLTVGSLSTSYASVTAISASLGTISTLSANLVNVGTMVTSVVSLQGANVINFGSDQTKATSAGNVGYQITTSGALDIYGAGVTVGSRTAKIWDNLLIPGSITSAGANLGSVSGTQGNIVNMIGTSLALLGPASIPNLTLGGATGTGAAYPISMPVLTENTGGGFTVSASSTQHPTTPAFLAFASNTSQWVSANATYAVGPSTGTYTGNVRTGTILGEYLQVQTPAAYNLLNYTLCGASSHYITQFIIAASTDNSTYTTIDSRTAQDCRAAKFFNCPLQSQMYSYFRLIIQADQDTTTDQVTMITTFNPVFSLPLARFQLDVTGQGRIAGNVFVNGVVSKGSGTFQIPHPIREGYDLLHSFIEGPRCDLIYRGRKRLRNGKARVDIERDCTAAAPMTFGTFEALCSDPQIALQNNKSWDKVRGYVSRNLLYIECENVDSDVMVDWMVIAERKDPSVRKWDKTDDAGRLITEHPSQ